MNNIKDNIRKYKTDFTTVIIILFFTLVIYILPADILFNNDFRVCIHKQWFGFECPFCGTTRAVYQLIHFRIAPAIEFNPAVLFLFLYFFIVVIKILTDKKIFLTLQYIVLFLTICCLLLLYIMRFYNTFLI